MLRPVDRIEHIARHDISPDEFEEVCFGNSLVLRSGSEGPNPVYHVLGQMLAGRHLLCILNRFPDEKGYPVTARPMTERAACRPITGSRPALQPGAPRGGRG